MNTKIFDITSILLVALILPAMLFCPVEYALMAGVGALVFQIFKAWAEERK